MTKSCIGHIDFAITERCWNLYDSYGYICVGCGCCARDKKHRYESRIKCLERWLNDQYNFNNWIEGHEDLQKENIKSNIRFFKRRLRYYKNKMKVMEVEENKGEVFKGGEQTNTE